MISAVFLACAAATFSSGADEHRYVIDAARALDAATPAVPEVVITRTPPDPPALVERSQWVFDLRWEHGEVFLVGIHPLTLPAPQATPRVVGRFALELFEGPTLVERARFDFPLLGAEDPDGGIALSPKLRTRIGVLFPATGRGTTLQLVDRATRRRWALPWPVPQGATEPASDGSDAGTAPVDAQRR